MDVGPAWDGAGFLPGVKNPAKGAIFVAFGGLEGLSGVVVADEAIDLDLAEAGEFLFELLLLKRSRGSVEELVKDF